MALVDRHGDAVQWKVVANQRGIENLVAVGPDAVRIKPYFYLYVV